ncbi:hypothetical protein PDIP_30680 [Penicillium digitatum Pd1]|nr:hypothetical protein PDIP_30680 [Penicillium digitatum Pd1]EKV17655.1 hypothetical protein PDIP_30680 [Penicillium digitatum Pd1]
MLLGTPQANILRGEIFLSKCGQRGTHSSTFEHDEGISVHFQLNGVRVQVLVPEDGHRRHTRL